MLPSSVRRINRLTSLAIFFTTSWHIKKILLKCTQSSEFQSFRMLITIDSSWKAHGKIFKKNMLSVLELRSISSSQMVLLPHWYLITEGTPGRKHYFSKFKVTEKVRNNFWSLLTVHLSIILVTDQLNAPILVFIMTLLYLSTCFEHNRAHHQEVKIVSHSIWHHHTLQAVVRCTSPAECDDARCCVIQFWPPDDEHGCACNM